MGKRPASVEAVPFNSWSGKERPVTVTDIARRTCDHNFRRD
ncbi:hypothetical protein [Sphingomonas oryzagri]